MTRIAVFGATSGIARATARIWAADGADLCLVGRDASRLQAERADIALRAGDRGRVHATVADPAAEHGQPAMLVQVERVLGGIDVALVSFGALPDATRAESDLNYAMETVRVNLNAPISLIALLAERMAASGGGVIAVVSSVAGDRGRGSNPFYGAAKSGLTAFLSGMRGRFAARGVHVLTIKPGFVDTPMTAHLPHNALYASPHTIGRGIVRAVARRADVVYLPWFWRWIMLIVKLVPERVFKRLKF